jgi:aminoglycoside phosphotransferase family enzyme/predicted kinase
MDRSSGEPWAAVRETHCGVVVLLGRRAYKVKKPVALGFLDFTDRAARLRVCEREVDLNRRLAPDVYLGVGGIRDPDGVVEPTVVMRRMPEDARLSGLLARGDDVTHHVDLIARVLASFHSTAPRGPHIDVQGTAGAITARWDASFDQTRPYAGTMLPAELLAEIEDRVHRFLAGRDELFDDRIRRGAVVDGHGDLTLDDIFCLPDGPRLLDCLEFDDDLRHLDRLDDIAFLAMGLEDAGAPALARRLVETWADLLGDPAPPALLHHFIAYRAFVRAKVACLGGAQLDRPAQERVTGYAELALSHLRTGAVTLVLVGGPPGVGKSTLAGHVAQRLGMVVLSSDRLRKEGTGRDPTSGAAAPYGEGIYTAARTRATYDELVRRAAMLLRRGESVVLDASWTDGSHRRLAEAVAADTHADLVALRCELDRTTAAERLRTRRARTGLPGPDVSVAHVSDADEAVAQRMREVGSAWPESIAIDMRPSPETCAEQACSHIRPHDGPLPMLRRRPRLEPG